ncbi:MAG: Coenzyme F420 hydrogenase/dehydrogenase, beta subunit C-terminal domain [Eubacteriales bacterium]
MKTVCESGKCAGCMACSDACPVGAVEVREQMTLYRAVIDGQKCIGCGLCERVCPTCTPTEGVRPLSWHQGWAGDDEIRRIGSSGGVASALSAAFLQSGGTVCSCLFKDGKFGFALFDRPQDARAAGGSKYVKSSPKGIYPQVRQKLREGGRVLFIGLPCQVAGIQNFVGKELQTRLYTADLICHGTPAPSVLDRYLDQYGCELNSIKKISFRKKTQFGLSSDCPNLPADGARDPYTIAFLNGLSYTENCYSCPYASPERVGDLTLGDSWGTELSVDEQKKGISLILCQTSKGTELLDMANLVLRDVDPDKAMAWNAQLCRPTECPKERERFLSDLEKGARFNSIVRRIYPKQYLKQRIKAVWIRWNTK